MRLPQHLSIVGQYILNPLVFFSLLTAYLIAIWFLRLWLFPAGSADDAEQLFFAQSLELGYKPGQPPLYTWIVWAAEQVFGVSLGLVVAIKYAFIWLTHAMAFLLGRQLTKSDRWGVFTSICLFGVYYLAWDSILNYSQTVLIAALAFAGIAAVHAVIRKGSTGAVMAFGIIVGIGIMTKYNFALFSIALVGATLLDRRGRVALIGRGGIIGLGVALLITLPHLVWLVTGHVSGGELGHAIPAMSVMDDTVFAWGPFLTARGAGLLDTLEATVSVLLPFPVIWLIFFPRAARRIGPAADSDVTSDLRLMERIFGLFLLQVLLMVAIAGMTEVRNHWFIVLGPFIAYAVLRTAAVYGDPAGTRERACSAFMLALPAVVAVGISVVAAVEKRTCFDCDMVIPYGQVAEGLKRSGFVAGRIIASDQPAQITGNLRPYLPDSRFESLVFESYESVSRLETETCVAIWLAATGTKLSSVTNSNLLKNRLKDWGEFVKTSIKQLDVTIKDDKKQTYAFIEVEPSGNQNRCTRQSSVD